MSKAGNKMKKDVACFDERSGIAERSKCET